MRPHPPRYRRLSPYRKVQPSLPGTSCPVPLRSSALQPLHTFELGSLQVCTEGSCCPQHQAPRLVRRHTRRSWSSRSPESARNGAWFGHPAKSVPVGPRLTRRCSGLTSFAAELHFVRRRSINENRLGNHTALRSRSPAHSFACSLNRSREAVGPVVLCGLSALSRGVVHYGRRAASSSSVPPLPPHAEHWASLPGIPRSELPSILSASTPSHLFARFLQVSNEGFLLFAASSVTAYPAPNPSILVVAVPESRSTLGRGPFHLPRTFTSGAA